MKAPCQMMLKARGAVVSREGWGLTKRLRVLLTACLMALHRILIFNNRKARQEIRMMTSRGAIFRTCFRATDPVLQSRTSRRR